MAQEKELSQEANRKVSMEDVMDGIGGTYRNSGEVQYHHHSAIYDSLTQDTAAQITQENES